VRGRVFYDLNGNGLSDVGEPGVAGIKIQIDGKRSVITDKNGRYELAANEGRHSIVLVSGELGVRILASTPTEQNVTMDGGQKLDLNFGVRDFGSISGRVFNDIGMQTQTGPGLGGVKVTLRSADVGFGSFVLEQLTAADGAYDFRNLRPGKYLIEIDPSSVPPNFLIPAITGSTILVEALHGSVFDAPIVAQRAVAGIVFIDKDGDGRFTPGTDESVEGASVTANDKSSISGVDGVYILRNLPAGRANLLVRLRGVIESTSFAVELGPEPVTRRAVDLSLAPKR
jgi:hypothetical protein